MEVEVEYGLSVGGVLRQQVDPEAMRNSALLLSWLRLVQAARSREEQNMEAFLKAGQLFVRTTRDVRQDEELLVWYDQELSNLLGLRDASRAPRQGEEERWDPSAIM